MTEKTKPKRKDNTSKEAKRNYAQKRLLALNESALLAGYDNWRDLERAVYKGAGVTIPSRKVE